MTKTLKTPHQWMAEEGTYVHNNGVWREGIRTEYVPIDHETYRRIITPLTRMFNLTPIQETVGVDDLKERIETKIEEFKETREEFRDEGEGVPDLIDLLGFTRTNGTIEGLEIALSILEELSVL
jgi:hypothetical protein